MMADQVADPVHLNARDTTFAYASRAPAAGHRAAERSGWAGPGPGTPSPATGDVDFGVDEWHGTNVFFRDGDRVFRTYFTDKPRATRRWAAPGATST